MQQSSTAFSAAKSSPSAGPLIQFSVGGVTVRVKGDREPPVTLVSPLWPFRIDTGCPDITIRVKRVARILPAQTALRFDSGAVWRLHENADGLQFDFSVPIFGERPYKRMLVDRQFRTAELWMSDECIAAAEPPPSPLDYPLDELLITHRLAQEDAVELHACGVSGPNSAANLFVGHSGAGKSTSARLWHALPGVEILSDDRIIVRRCHGELRMFGTPWHGEGAFASPASVPFKRIFILQHGRRNVLTRLSSAQAVAELLARSFVPLHGHEYVEAALAFLQDVASVVPVYRFEFEPDEGAVQVILALRD